MILYRITHYVFFLFLGCVTLLYCLRDSVGPVPVLENVFTYIESVYDSLPRKKVNEAHQEQFKDIASSMFADSAEQIDKMISSIGFYNALDRILEQDVNDMEYLIYEYLDHVYAFQDFLIYKGNKLIYKYNKVSTDSSLIFQYSYTRYRNKVTVEVHFYNSIIHTMLNKMNIPMFIKDYKGHIYSPKAYSNMDANIIAAIRQNTNTDHSFFSVIKGKNLYSMFISEDLKYPLQVYGLYNNEKGGIGLFQFLFLLIWPLFWVLCIMVDLIVYKKVVAGCDYVSEQSAWLSLVNLCKKNHSNQETITDKDTVDQTLEWLDRFMVSEEPSAQKSVVPEPSVSGAEDHNISPNLQDKD